MKAGKATATKAKGAESKPPAPMKTGILELNKVRITDLKEAFPRFNREATRKSIEKEIGGKVG